MDLILKSPAFKNCTRIPSRYTCDGADISPAIEWTILNDNIKSFALFCNDINSIKGSWIHWLIYNIPGNQRSLPENIPHDLILENGAVQGINDFGTIGYGGPYPHTGTHNYIFTLYALNTLITAKRYISKETFDDAIKGRIIAQADLTGTYTRI